MNKILFGIFTICLLSFATANAQEFYTTNQGTIGWTQDYDGIPTAEVKWNIYIANAVTDPQKANPVQIATSETKQYVVTFNTEGKYFVGVSAIRFVDNEVVGESEISWSDEQDVAFGFKYYIVPLKPTGLEKL